MLYIQNNCKINKSTVINEQKHKFSYEISISANKPTSILIKTKLMFYKKNSRKIIIYITDVDIRTPSVPRSSFTENGLNFKAI